MAGVILWQCHTIPGGCCSESGWSIAGVVNYFLSRSKFLGQGTVKVQTPEKKTTIMILESVQKHLVVGIWPINYPRIYRILNSPQLKDKGQEALTVNTLPAQHHCPLRMQTTHAQRKGSAAPVDSAVFPRDDHKKGGKKEKKPTTPTPGNLPWQPTLATLQTQANG